MMYEDLRIIILKKKNLNVVNNATTNISMKQIDHTDREKEILNSERVTLTISPASVLSDTNLPTELSLDFPVPNFTVMEMDIISSNRTTVKETEVTQKSETHYGNVGVAIHVLNKWLDESPLQVITELTPDNSFKYLDGTQVMVIQLIDTSKKKCVARSYQTSNRVTASDK